MSLLLLIACKTKAAQIALEYPNETDKVYVSLPYFEWSDAVEHPYPGDYEIEIANETNAVCTDKVPACISWYSPAFELAAGRYHWRVRYIDPKGGPQQWAEAVFTIRRPAFVIDVETTDIFVDIRAKLAKAKANSSGGALMRFPPNHTFHLTQTIEEPSAEQESGEGALLNVAGASNLIIDGRGSKIVLRTFPLAKEDIATKEKTRAGRTVTRTTTRGCGFFFARQSQHIQVKNLTLDYANDSLMQFAGQITDIDRGSDTITVKVNTNVYGNFEEMNQYKDIYFVDAGNNQRIGVKGVSYPLRKSWGGSARGNGIFELQPTAWERFEDELKVGHWAVTSHRGGDAFLIFNGCKDIVVNNCRVEGCRGRYFIVKHVQPNIRCVNNEFVRTPGRIMGAPSGGVNTKGEKCWFENCVFEYTRDDSFHAGGACRDIKISQTVVRNTVLRGAFRNTLWMHSDRCWVEGNRLLNCGITGMNLSGAGLGGQYDTIDVGIIRNNLIADANKTSFEAHGDADHVNKHLRIEGNIASNNRMNEAFLITHLNDSVFANNRVEATNTDWRVYSESERQQAFAFANCSNVTGEGNAVTDQRLDKPSWLRVEDSCSEVSVSVVTPDLENSTKEQCQQSDGESTPKPAPQAAQPERLVRTVQ